MKSIKKYIALSVLALAALSCSKDSNDSSTLGTKNDAGSGQGGSLARFAIVGDYMYAVHGRSLKVMDITDRTNPNFVSTAQVNADVETLFARDESTLFIGSTTGMYVYSAAGSQVDLVDSYAHITSCDPVVANSDYAYVTLRTRTNEVTCNRGNVNQLDVVDISNLSNIHVVNEVQMEFPIGLGIHENTLMVCDNGLKVYDITDGANPQFITKEEVNAVDIIPYGDLMIVSTVSGISQYRYNNGQLEFLSSL